MASAPRNEADGQGQAGDQRQPRPGGWLGRRLEVAQRDGGGDGAGEGMDIVQVPAVNAGATVVAKAEAQAHAVAWEQPQVAQVNLRLAPTAVDGTAVGAGEGRLSSQRVGIAPAALVRVVL